MAVANASNDVHLFDGVGRWRSLHEPAVVAFTADEVVEMDVPYTDDEPRRAIPPEHAEVVADHFSHAFFLQAKQMRAFFCHQ